MFVRQQKPTLKRPVGAVPYTAPASVFPGHTCYSPPGTSAFIQRYTTSLIGRFPEDKTKIEVLYVAHDDKEKRTRESSVDTLTLSSIVEALNNALNGTGDNVTVYNPGKFSVVSLLGENGTWFVLRLFIEVDGRASCYINVMGHIEDDKYQPPYDLHNHYDAGDCMSLSSGQLHVFVQSRRKIEGIGHDVEGGKFFLA